MAGEIKAEFVVEEKESIEVLLHGIDIGMAHWLVEKLLESKAIEFASVDYVHPTKRTPLLKVKGKGCKKAVADALKELEKDAKAASV